MVNLYINQWFKSTKFESFYLQGKGVWKNCTENLEWAFYLPGIVLGIFHTESSLKPNK